MNNRNEDIIEKNSYGSYFHKKDHLSREIVIYPAMCNIKNKDENRFIYLSDRECRFAISDVWRRLTEKINN